MYVLVDLSFKGHVQLLEQMTLNQVYRNRNHSDIKPFLQI